MQISNSKSIKEDKNSELKLSNSNTIKKIIIIKKMMFNNSN